MDTNDIRQRLDRYLELGEEKETEVTEFDSLAHLYGVFDAQKGTEVYACGRASRCACKDECMCDEDEYSKVTSTKLIAASNNILIIRFGFHTGFKTSLMQGIRFFSLDEDTDEESTVMDIRKTVKKNRKKRRYVESASLVVNGKSYDIDGNPRVDRGDLCVSVNYMYWE